MNSFNLFEKIGLIFLCAIALVAFIPTAKLSAILWFLPCTATASIISRKLSKATTRIRILLWGEQVWWVVQNPSVLRELQKATERGVLIEIVCPPSLWQAALLELKKIGEVFFLDHGSRKNMILIDAGSTIVSEEKNATILWSKQKEQGKAWVAFFDNIKSSPC